MGMTESVLGADGYYRRITWVNGPPYLTKRTDTDQQLDSLIFILNSLKSDVRRRICELIEPEIPEMMFGVPRAKEWEKLSKSWIKRHPTCAACGGTERVVPHHIIPYHVDATKELDEDNLITLCQAKTHNCHLIKGHNLDFRSWNIYVVEDCVISLSRIKNRPYKDDPNPILES